MLHFVFLESELLRRGPCGNDDARRVVGSGAGSAQAQRLFPAMLVDRVGAAWSSTCAVDCLASTDAGLDACSRLFGGVCAFLYGLPGRPVCLVFGGHVVTVFAQFFVN